MSCPGVTAYDVPWIDEGAACSLEGGALAFRLEAPGVATLELARGGTFSEWNADTGLITAGVCSSTPGELAGRLECLDAGGSCTVAVDYELEGCE